MKKILLGIVMAFGVLVLTGCDSTATTSNENDGKGENTTKELATYGLNEDIYVTNDEGKYRIKITGVKETKERNEYSETEAKRVVIVSYEYENISLTDDLYISSMDFKGYDKENNSLETYEVIDYKYPNNISTGRKAAAEMVWALNSDTNYIELEYYDNMFNSSADCIIKIEW